MSKNKSKELDVDFIGGQGALTIEEEQRISEFLSEQKLKKAKKNMLALRKPKAKKNLV